MPKNNLSINKKPDYSKLDSKLKAPNQKYNSFPAFPGSPTEYNTLAGKMYDAGYSKEDVVNQLGILKSKLNKADYPHVLPEHFTTGDQNISVARGSGKNKDGSTKIKNESIYEGANTANRRVKNEMNQSITTDKDGKFEYHRFDKNKREAGIKPGDGFDLHHKRTLNQFAPFYEGLTDVEAIELTNWFDQEGYTVGNNKKNLLKMTEAQHMGSGSIHEWMDDRRLNPKTNMAEYKQLADHFKDRPLNDRFADIVRYLDNTQEQVEARMGTRGGYTGLNELRESVGTIQSGPRAGQRLPVNRRTLGDTIIRDIVKPPLNEVAQSAFESEILDKVPPNAFASVVSSKVPPKTTSAPQSTVRTPSTTPSTPKPTQTKTTPTGYVHRNRTPSETPPVTVSKTPPPTVLENLNTGLQNTLKIGGAIGAGALAIGKDMLFGFNP